jgi:hypothetical protein
MFSPYTYGGYGSPYSGGYGEYGVSAPRAVPVPVPYPMKGMVTDPGMSGRNVDLNAPIPEGGQLETRGRGLNKYDALIGESVTKNPFTRFLGGLADFATFGVHDFDKRGNLFGGEHKKGLLPWVGGSGYGRKWDQEAQNKLLEEQRGIRPRGASPDRPVSPYLDPKWIAARDNYMNMIQDRDMRRSLAYYDMYADRAYQNNLRNLAAQTPWIKDAAYFREALPSNIENLAASAQRRYLNATQAKVNLAEAAAIPAREAIKAALMGRFQPGNVAPATIANPGSYSA